jgi:hypothetical protein
LGAATPALILAEAFGSVSGRSHMPENYIAGTQFVSKSIRAGFYPYLMDIS